MAAVSYITLETSNASKSLKFRVIQDYDDGTYNRSESLRRAIDGSIDHSVGAVYRTWMLTIRVRHTEPESGYGTLSELEDFYKLNNPNATPSNDITFISHHDEAHPHLVVHIVGQMQKQIMGYQIEGNQAWYICRLALVNTVAEA